MSGTKDSKDFEGAKVFDFETWKRARGRREGMPAQDEAARDSFELRQRRIQESISRVNALVKELKGKE
jgi:hypothetical protein